MRTVPDNNFLVAPRIRESSSGKRRYSPFEVSDFQTLCKKNKSQMHQEKKYLNNDSRDRSISCASGCFLVSIVGCLEVLPTECPVAQWSGETAGTVNANNRNDQSCDQGYYYNRLFTQKLAGVSLFWRRKEEKGRRGREEWEKRKSLAKRMVIQTNWRVRFAGVQ